MPTPQAPRTCCGPGSRRQLPCPFYAGSHIFRQCGVRTVRTRGSSGAQSVATGLLQPRWEVQTPLGRLLIRPIERDEVQAAAVVLTRAFASSAEAVALNEVLKDIESMLPVGPTTEPDSPSDPTSTPGVEPGEAPAGYFLVARLFPNDPQQPPLPPGQQSRLVGTACLSLSADSQPLRRLPPVNLPPAHGAYVSNMAVDPRVRRRGVARALLAACEDAAARARAREVWLHVREADGGARALYEAAGYDGAAKDSWLDTMKYGGMRCRLLMRRELPHP